MTVQENLQTRIANETAEDLIPFLQQLDSNDKKALIPVIKQLNSHYTEFVELEKNRYGMRGTATQQRILGIVSFVCLDKKDFEKTWYANSILKKETLELLLPWYQPAWLGDLILSYEDREFVPFDYQLLMWLAAQGLAVPSPLLVARLLPYAIYKSEQRATGQKLYGPENLFVYPETLATHVWYLFEYPSDINWVNGGGDTGDKTPWQLFFAANTANGKLDRERVLQACLQATTRNFNKVLSGWFVDLFTIMAPDEKELLLLRQSLLLSLGSPHSKVVNAALAAIKHIWSASGFDRDALLDHLPPVMTSDTKSVVMAGIALIEKLCPSYPDLRLKAVLLLCQALLSKQEAVQVKAAKLIAQYGVITDAVLKAQLEQLQDMLLVNTRKALADFALPAPIAAAEDITPEQAIIALTGAHNIIEPVTTTAELIFLASQAFENNAAHHFDLLPATLVTLQSQIDVPVLQALEPAFQRAFVIYNRLPGNAGFLDQLLALFFLHYGRLMATRFPEYGAYLLRQKGKHWWPQTVVLPPLAEWGPAHSDGHIFMPARQLLVNALQKITAGDTLPLLSTPTHTPAWIDPLVLVQRLQQYQQQPHTPADMDFQVAITRCALQDTAAAWALAVKELTGEYRQLMRFLLDTSAMPEPPFTQPQYWMQAGITKTPQATYPAFAAFSYNEFPAVYLHGQFEWTAMMEKYLAYGTYDREKGEYERYEAEWPALRIALPENTTAEVLLSSPAPLLQAYLGIVPPYLSVTANDLQRLLLLTPGHPDVLLARIIHHDMSSSSFAEVTEISHVTAIIRTLLELMVPLSAVGHLFVASCMFHADKTIRAYAAELWISGVMTGYIDSREIGRITGLEERIEWAPLKRFTDLIAGSMIKISALHNRELEILLTTCLEQLPDKPIKDLKKLLELYHEVLSVNGQPVSSNIVQEKLQQWQQTAGLKKTIKDLLP
ncbi:DUF6493 family protein [Chitinophaga nivalis]|uniref:DUF6493 family protein n=1 Tax=Chitinophaga nivalis TaxID=2991709 RepID=A0ABT3IHX1_9BACT|nr:DUF6493 family protein [Chitinophaga nivalis]MCW3466752.1 DUF6493 family protein [Chitinophaga nivalis]MCW3483557.1 DUF6493 family protein [Chitinophaga nivalis]